MLHQCLVHRNLNIRNALSERDGYVEVEQLYRPLKMMYDSLLLTGDESAANARLLDLLRQVWSRVWGRQ